MSADSDLRRTHSCKNEFLQNELLYQNSNRQLKNIKELPFFFDREFFSAQKYVGTEEGTMVRVDRKCEALWSGRGGQERRRVILGDSCD